jgi:NAD(P)-dependent dehydrogenase (short-subunit alcohol dehydrogenase family)
MSLLEGKVAFVTGAGGTGIGRGSSMELAAAGASVVVTARKIEATQKTADAIAAEGGTALALALDVSDRAAVEKAVATTIERFGRLDIVIQNAVNGASSMSQTIEEQTVELMREHGAVSLDGAFYLARAAFPHLKAGGEGRMVFFTSLRGIKGSGANPIYAAQKGAIRGLTKSLAREWGRHGITVNAIAPASMSDATLVYFEANPGVREMIEASVPMRRMGDGRTDVGGVIVALCSPLCGYMTGQTLFVDGGGYTGL